MLVWYNIPMRGRIVFLLGFIALFGVLLMLNFSTPTKAGVLGVLVFFTMVFMMIFSLMVGLIKVFQKIQKPKSDKKRAISENKVYMYAAVLAFGPIILMITRSFELHVLILVGMAMFLSFFLIQKRV